MNTTKKRTVLAALANRASRFRKDGKVELDPDDKLFEEALDETGTVVMEGMTDPELESGEVEMNATMAKTLEQEEILHVSDDLLKVHGVPPAKKREGCMRFVYENPDGISNRISGNEKLDKAKELLDELEVDAAAFSEHRQNLKHKDNKHGFSQLFNGGEADVRSVVGHNVHENVSRVQQGGTSLLLFGDLVQHLDMEQSGCDDSGLGRWSVMTLTGEDGFKTRLVCGYNPCYNNKKGSSTTYQQHRRFLISTRKDLTCPRKKFKEDLVAQLKKWRAEGDRIILAMDANEHIYNKSLGKELTDAAGLDMSEVVGDFTGEKIGATFFRGTKPIDAVWATKDITVASACVMPVGYGIGDHRLFVIDFVISTLIGNAPPKAVLPKARRLNTRLPHCVDKYLVRLRGNFLRHKIFDRLGEIHDNKLGRSKAEIAEELDKINDERKDYMLSAEKKCRRIKSGRIPFSPQASIWIRRSQVYRSLLRFHAGKIRNRGNLKRAARRCKIHSPFTLSLQEIRLRLRVCKEKCKYFRKHGMKYRRKHLNERLKAAQDREDEEAEQKILAIIQREKDRSFWRRLNYAMGKNKRGRGVRVVHSEDEFGADPIEHNTKAGVEDAIWNEIHKKRFFLAEEAPICQGKLRGDFGYCAISPTAKAVLDGTYDYPDDFDEATRELCEECARIRLSVPARSVSTLITRERWQEKWGKAKEETSSSESGLHMGHYKAGAQCPIVSHLHALFTSIALRRGIAPKRWSRGLSVMLEKMFGCTLVKKLRSILLMEADFNYANKEIYGNRMMYNVRKYGYMAEEIFSEKGRMADDGSLAKILFYDIIRQKRIPAGLSSVDAAQCYDRIAHAIASLVFQAFGVPEEAVQSMLESIQDMKYFLRTAFGDSTDYASSSVQVKFQGLCQGNGAAPAGWAVISITVLNAHKRKGHGAKFVCPISRLTGHLAAILYVDDCDLIHIDLEGQETVHEAHEAMQASVVSWGQLLIATGGSLKPEKCFYHLVSFEWKVDGTWKYAKNEKAEDFQLVVPLPDGSFEQIEHASVDTVKETLGVFTCVSGKSDDANVEMAKKAQEWIDNAKNGKVQRRNLWFLLDASFWPKVSYGLNCNLSSFEVLSECLQKQWYQILPMGGIKRSVKKGIRQLSRGFYGAGCPHPGVECLVAQANKIMMHYGCQSSVGLKLQMSMEFLIIELGISLQPLQESYARYGKFVTHSWLKTLWEKVDMFDFLIEVNNISLKPPRRGDDWLMRKFWEIGFDVADLIKLNKVRLHQQVVFFSDVMDASGRRLDKKYLEKRPDGEKWSSLTFPTEKPPRAFFSMWKEALLAITTGVRLGEYESEGYKTWDWRFDDNEENSRPRLLHLKGDVMDVYFKSADEQFVHMHNRWTRTRLDEPVEKVGQICSVKLIRDDTMAIVAKADPPPSPSHPSTFLEVLEEWGSEWMWEKLQLQGEDGWLEEAIRDNSLIAVTDGSYIKELLPNVNSAAFVLVCSKGRGRLIGAFPEQTMAACAYRGELLGLLAIHLLLLSINKVNPTLDGSVHIFSDCLGALGRVENLPPHRIPSRCRHSDILKTIMVNCSSLSFKRYFSHVSAHTMDNATAEEFNKQPLEVRYNSAMDYGAKCELWDLDPDDPPDQQPFPLESMCMFVREEKMTSDTASHIRFHAHRELAKDFFEEYEVLDREQFEEVDWDNVYAALELVPRMFQIWACKQVMDIAPTFKNLSKYTAQERWCPSCCSKVEDCAHILECDEEGRVEALMLTIDMLELWLQQESTDPGLADCIVRYARGRGGVTMEEICSGKDDKYYHFAVSQDKIGWRRFMEGMISKECTELQLQWMRYCGSKKLITYWATGLVTRLLEVTHGQWLYRNIVVHDSVSGAKASLRKEEIQMEIEMQQELGEEGLLEEDKYLLEVNLEDLETTNGERQEYWLLAIRAAREACRLRSEREREGNADEGDDGLDLTLPPRVRRCTRCPRNEIETESEDDMMESLINGAVETHNRDGT